MGCVNCRILASIKLGQSARGTALTQSLVNRFLVVCYDSLVAILVEYFFVLYRGRTRGVRKLAQAHYYFVSLLTFLLLRSRERLQSSELLTSSFMMASLTSSQSCSKRLFPSSFYFFMSSLMFLMLPNSSSISPATLSKISSIMAITMLRMIH